VEAEDACVFALANFDVDEGCTETAIKISSSQLC